MPESLVGELWRTPATTAASVGKAQVANGFLTPACQEMYA